MSGRDGVMNVFKTKVAHPFLELLAFLNRENLFRLMGVIVVLILVGAVGLTYFEENRPFPDALWWAIVTVTTVGFGDISPTSLGGRLIGVVLMFFGIGVLGMFTATIAGVFVEKRLRKERGMGSYDLEGHIILCEWNDRTKEILKDLRADSRAAGAPIVLVADIDAKPVVDEQLYFVRGELTEEQLKRAGIEKAATVVLVGDRSLEHGARDAKAVLSVLTVESLNPDAYSIVELVSEENVRHCERAGADEIIVGAEFSSRVISTATLDHGISTVLRELLSAQVGHDLITVPVPAGLAGRPFLDVFSNLKREGGMIALAVLPHGAGDVVTNPDGDTIVNADDRLVVVSARKRHAP
ncbi:MAG: ion channel [Vicinamibacterales bacterium]|nr:ion channel [Vicinamibacterales bacterium]